MSPSLSLFGISRLASADVHCTILDRTDLLELDGSNICEAGDCLKLIIFRFDVICEFVKLSLRLDITFLFSALVPCSSLLMIYPANSHRFDKLFLVCYQSISNVRHVE